jgi:hypothetical protein
VPLDLITSLFQIGAVIFLLDNIRMLLKDRQLKGVSIGMIFFFTLWGYWGIYMFHMLKQTFSMWTNVAIAVAYTVWLTLAFYFKK